MQKVGTFITKFRKEILIIAMLLLIPAYFGMKATKINYDILVYLPEDIQTIQGQKILAEDFNMGTFSIVIVDDMSAKDVLKLEDKIREIKGVTQVASLSDITGTAIPEEMLPDKVKDKLYKDNETLMLVTFEDETSADSTMEAVEELRKTTKDFCKVSGMTATLIDTRDLSDSEVLIYVVIAVLLVLIILQVALDSYFAPLLILGSIGCAILYNLGSNILLGEISYITKAISAVLQLGVTMDFSIFLYHSYKEEQEKLKNSRLEKAKLNENAMANAISKTLVAVLGSATTTIAGFLALCSMELTLGKDIGLVMAKGVLLGLISAVTILPSLILVFDRLIEKTKHKVILPKFRRFKDFSLKNYIAILIVFLVLVPFATWGYFNTKVYYKMDSALPETLSSVEANNELHDKFNIVTTEMILVNKDMPENMEKKMVDEIKNIDGIKTVLSYAEISDTIPKEILPNDIKNIFETDKYRMIIVSSNYEIATTDLNNQINEINNVTSKYGDDIILAGEGPLMKDLVEISDHDFNSVNWVSIGIIFILMIIVLKSGVLPILLMFAIEFAIFINMGIPAYTGETLPFVASIVIGTIQLGATIDYAILITTKYIGLRKEGKDKNAAIDEALGTSINSVVVSALCFFGATFGVGIYSKISLISSLCILMARGAIISMVVVLTVLPALLKVFDKVICKTTYKMKKLV